ncbi:AAA domain-containing protein [Actinoplanes sp. KI2]|uniref:AAA domain-containing protein n=1 Tax=Actinoplanes sp. KI2 TaxID=2983315 RepID=UPI0021D5F457|nr:AAA domain-containing protein [Actinoplanes sp. KI2]MCU7728882.1 AAA domain-containing protein [Actinoplanes sp. KI2]
MDSDAELTRERQHLLDILKFRAEKHRAHRDIDYDIDGKPARLRMDGELGNLDKPVAVGRIVDPDGPLYIGPATLIGPDGEILTVSWKADAARRFFEADHRNPLGVISRRKFDFDEDLVLTSFQEVVFEQLVDDIAALEGRPDLSVDAALLADLERSRSGELREIVQTIQAAQYDLITAPLDRVLVIQGGPGTGKTAIAMHRISWLLHQHRDRLQARDVLVVGPTRAFSRYIRDILPELGDYDVRHLAVDQFFRGAAGRGHDTPDVARLKGDARMARLMVAALNSAVRGPGAEPTISVSEGNLRLEAAPIRDAVARLAAENGPYLVRRRTLRERLLGVIERSSAWIPQRTVEAAATSLTNRFWPTFSAEALVRRALTETLHSDAGRRLFDDTERDLLAAGAETSGSVADVALWDEAEACLSGNPDQYDLIVVDEAQDLSAMQLRAVARRSRSGAVTLVGDIAQSTGPHARDSWIEVLAHMPVLAPHTVEHLRYGYRVPRQIFALAAPLLASAAANVPPAQVVRTGPAEPGLHPRSGADLAAQVVEVARAQAGDGHFVGIVCAEPQRAVIVRALDEAGIRWSDVDRDQFGTPIVLASPNAVKGLEFDATVVVEPAEIIRSDPRGHRLLYIAMTRSTKYLDLVYSDANVDHLNLPEPAGQPPATGERQHSALVEQIAQLVAEECRKRVDELAGAAIRDAVIAHVAGLLGGPETAHPPLLDPPPDDTPARVVQWTRSLIDLSLRNPLLNLPSGGTGLRLDLPGGALAVLDDLIHDGAALELLSADDPRLARGDASPDKVATAIAHLNAGRLVTNVSGYHITKKLRGLQRDALTMRQETGSSYLYLTLGSLVHRKSTGEPAHAPLFLLPVHIDGGIGGRPYTIVADTSELAVPNQCLIEWLRVKHGLRIPALENPQTDASGIDIPQTLQAIRDSLLERGIPYQVTEAASLRPLKFGAFGLWRDLTEHWRTFATNPVVERLITGARMAADISARQLDDVAVDETALVLPLPADGSQLKAAAAAVAGRSFVLEGPPGTGKSQTITNLIAGALDGGKTVLVVAEKQAALDVVRHRLERTGLAPFILDLYGVKQTSRTIRRSLHDAIGYTTGAVDPAYPALESAYRDSVRELTEYQGLVYRPGPGGKSLWSAWLDAQGSYDVLQDWSALIDSFDSQAHTRHIDELATAGAKLREHLPSRLAGRLVTRRNDLFRQRPADVTTLREQLRPRVGPSFRDLFQEFADLVLATTPCVLASPAAVANYLAPGAATFDLVVFDEASQVREAEAIGAMGRGRTTVIVGDAKQMPPTTVIKTARLDASGDGSAEPDSILDGAVEVGLPRHRLSWHYRSQHESLIDFSNNRYYDGELRTLPPPALNNQAIGWRRVDGHYDRGGSRDNPREAQAIVAEIQRRVGDPATAGDSIGVVTLNIEQRDLILNLLETSPDPGVIARMGGDEPIFVKNLETVQGDERDLILFSLGYSTNPTTGKVPLHLGPLARAGGERRWNVAITRARREVLLFASFDPEAIDAKHDSSLGIRHLREYCELAAHGPSATSDRIDSPERESDALLESVATAIRARGHEVAIRYGRSHFTVDIAVRAPGSARWQVAVMADGPAWNARPTIADRELAPALLQSLMGWSAVERFWLPGWIQNPHELLDRIDAAVAEANRAEQPGDRKQGRVVGTSHSWAVA